jgi:hypothetical protein
MLDDIEKILEYQLGILCKAFLNYSHDTTSKPTWCNIPTLPTPIAYVHAFVRREKVELRKFECT